MKHKLKPFVKWAGGKTQILDKLKASMPKEYNTYHEPFVGGGALFLDLEPEIAYIYDANKELMDTFSIFKDKETLDNLKIELDNHEKNHNEEYYLQIRNLDREDSYNKLTDYEKAARFIYLNKAGFNGLYRVNRKGYFNVPSGKRKKVTTYNKVNFNNLYKYFTNNKIGVITDDFSKVLDYAKEGDFVYFDPPYDTYDDDGFTSYTPDKFGRIEQAKLSFIFKELDNRGVYVMLSNHNTELINLLYDKYKIKVIKSNRVINSKGNKRGPVEEVIITNY